MAATTTISAGGGVFRLKWRCSGVPDEIGATCGFIPSDLPIAVGNNDQPGIAAASIADAFLGAFEPATLNNFWTFEGVDVSMWPDGQTAGGNSVPPVVGSAPRNSQGAMGGGVVPANCCMLVEKSTQLGGKVGKGRMFFPAGYLPRDQVGASGVIEPGFLSTLNGYLNQFFNNLADEAVQISLRLWHGERKRAGLIVGPAGAGTEINGLLMDPKIGNQRSRLGR